MKSLRSFSCPFAASEESILIDTLHFCIIIIEILSSMRFTQEQNNRFNEIYLPLFQRINALNFKMCVFYCVWNEKQKESSSVYYFTNGFFYYYSHLIRINSFVLVLHFKSGIRILLYMHEKQKLNTKKILHIFWQSVSSKNCSIGFDAYITVSPSILPDLYTEWDGLLRIICANINNLSVWLQAACWNSLDTFTSV